MGRPHARHPLSGVSALFIALLQWHYGNIREEEHNWLCCPSHPERLKPAIIRCLYNSVRWKVLKYSSGQDRSNVHARVFVTAKMSRQLKSNQRQGQNKFIPHKLSPEELIRCEITFSRQEFITVRNRCNLSQGVSIQGVRQAYRLHQAPLLTLYHEI